MRMTVGNVWVGMYIVRGDVDGRSRRDSRAVCRGEAAAVLERTVP